MFTEGRQKKSKERILYSLLKLTWKKMKMEKQKGKN